MIYDMIVLGEKSEVYMLSLCTFDNCLKINSACNHVLLTGRTLEENFSDEKITVECFDKKLCE